MVNANFESHVFDNTLLPFYYSTRDVPSLVSVSNWHPNIEFIHCISGNGSINCNGTTHEIRSGDLFIIHPNSLHAVQASSPIKYSYLIVSNHFCEENGIAPTELYFQQHICDPTISASFQNATRAFSEDHSDTTIHIAKIRHAVLGFLISLCDNYILDYHHSTEKPLPMERIMKATLFIHQNITTPITVDDIAEHLGICKSHLSREFRKITGMTIVEYINALRCKEAKRLISEGQSVTTAAAAAGFNNLSYFTRTYKKYIGELPSFNKK